MNLITVEQLAMLKTEMYRLKSENEALKDGLKESYRELEESRKRYNTLISLTDALCEEHSEKVAELECELAVKQSTIDRLNAAKLDHRNKLWTLENLVESYEEDIEELKQKLEVALENS